MSNGIAGNSRNLNQSKLLKKLKVKRDLYTYLSRFSCKTKGLKQLSISTGLSQRTIQRYIKGETVPQKGAISKIYEVINHSKDVENDDFTMTFSDPKRELKRNSVFRSIYLQACTKTIFKEAIGYKFGDVGLKTVSEMEKSGILKKTKNGAITLGHNKINFDEDVVKVFAEELINSHLDSSREKQFFCFLSSVSDKAYEKIITIQKEAVQKTIGVLKDPSSRGELPFWQILGTDTLKF